MTALTLRGLTVPGRLDPTNLVLEPGGVHLVLGPNGAGKTTLLRAIAGLVREARGEVSYGDRPLRGGAHQRADVLGWLPQTAPLEVGLSAKEVVATARFRFTESRAVADAAALDALQAVGLTAQAATQVDQLSGGERQRVRIAALLAQRAPWWLLDEPSNHLDPRVQLDVFEAIDRHASRGGVILITHDLLPLARWPEARVLGFEAGRCVIDARANDPALPAALSHLFGVPIRRTEGDALTVEVRPA